MKKALFFLFLISTYFASAQSHSFSGEGPGLAPLTVEKIMQDPQWMGTSPSDIFWSPDSKKLYFNWNPEKALSDSLYVVGLKNHHPRKVSPKDRRSARAERFGSWNTDRTQLTYKLDHRIYLLDMASHQRIKVIESSAHLSRPHFGKKGKLIVYREGQNLMAWNRETGTTAQLTNFKKGHQKKSPEENAQEIFLKEDALHNSRVLRERKKRKKAGERHEKSGGDQNFPTPVYIGKQKVRNLSLFPDGKSVFYSLEKRSKAKHTVVPNYVTESGYIEDMPGRSKVGVPQPEFKNYIYRPDRDTVIEIDLTKIPGIYDIPKFIKVHYPKEYQQMKAAHDPRSVYMSQPIWNRAGTRAFVVINALDHKDRWLMLLAADGSLKLLDRQHDDAWIAGPGIGYTYQTGNVGWIDENTIWYQSEKTGYSHLYTQNIDSKKARALTSGDYEVQEAELSPDRKSFYMVTNKEEPGQTQFYHLDIDSKKQTRLTQKKGGHEVAVSPDGKQLAFLYSTSIHPWELFLQENKENSRPAQITHKAESELYRSYAWQEPDIITFKDRDDLEVYAEIYKPEKQAPSRPGVIFVHGAGYLQDVKRSWSYYFREHMFMNLLADKGYTVMEIDYRGSAGYGRDWRTAIYRYMGKNDLADNVDGAEYMVENLNVNPDNIGIWGGSYGGFMTLMALFKTNTFKSGGALRSVTDWAHYNHGYTSDILNLPQNDSIAYTRSSPIYFADGLKGHLLMCHGMVDTNVHFQDIVRLSQKLIELGKSDWELAVYPVESHGFIEPSSWIDEYKRILKLFETTLK